MNDRELLERPCTDAPEHIGAALVVDCELMRLLIPKFAPTEWMRKTTLMPIRYVDFYANGTGKESA